MADDLRRVAALISADSITPETLAGADVAKLLEIADAHWLAPLLAERLLRDDARARLTPGQRDSCRHQLCFEGGFELVIARELRRIGDVFAREAIPFVVFKGAALAYTHYPAPYLRPRLDSDVLVRPEDRARAGCALLGLGYTPTPAVSGDAISHQAEYVLRTAAGLPHAVDLHWKIANPAVFANLLAADELVADAVPIDALGENVRTTSPAHTLLLLAIHRLAHHEADEGGLLRYDLHRAARALSETDWRAVIALAGSRGLTELCAHAVAASLQLFPARLPAIAEDWVAAGASRLLPPPFAPFARSGRRIVDVVASDLRAAAGLGARARLVREHLFPPASYMRARYGAPAWRLPYLYVRRIVTGIPRWFRRGTYK